MRRRPGRGSSAPRDADSHAHTGPHRLLLRREESDPGGNLEALGDVEEGGKASTIDRSVTVKFEALEASPGSCPDGASSNPTTVNLFIKDDDGEVVFIGNKKGFICTAGQKTHAKFGALRDQSLARIGSENLLISRAMRAAATQ